jgi:hypothetical protein
MSNTHFVISRTRLPRGAIFYYEPAFNVQRGILIPNPEWIAADCITLKRADGTLSIIPKRDIEGPVPQTEPPAVQHYAMYGSRGDIYTITTTPSGRSILWSCTCRGYEFRRDCRHIRETKNQLANEEVA